ncbi:hypothetical protein MAR_026514 [Mya arenaria]|uniref:DDE Tnp4 domain-containing protein n=1 Tax=Mya arenaria TaxID=6604 RepID=A0ABY7EVA7_MYAAR|nr:hypothetical protein MAR_026514 [Mya arenaria]
MVMMRLRLGLLVKDLKYRFKVASSTVSKSIVFLPELHVLQKHVPPCFSAFSDTRIVLDCTEIFNQSLTYSNYKSHNIFKVLVCVNMTGAVVLISKLWGGSVSDTKWLLEQLNAGDAVMVDKGFIHLKPDLVKKDVQLYCPPLKTKEQFTKEEVNVTRRIASARIHVERKMEQIKNFRILQSVMPLALNKIADEIFFVCGALTNLLPPLVS